MKLSFEWLADHIRLETSPEELAERFTASGNAVDSIEKVQGDHVLELEIPANRPDCLSIRGLAREASALYRTPMSDLGSFLQVEESGKDVSDSFALKNDIPHLCRRFTARLVRGVKIGPSPGWLAARLERSGLRLINNVVDITNYVMLELGHPLHAFDLGTLRAGRLHVRLARSGERLFTLDEAERTLADWMILIADGERPVSLAGVMGGLDTEISSSTTDVLLEAAWWDPVTIFRTGRALGLRSDAAYRFERRADPEATIPAVDRAARLVAELAGGQIAPGRIDEAPEPETQRRIDLRPERTRQLLGMDIAEEEANDILRRLEFQADGRSVLVPSHRGDIHREEDLIEEIGRIAGYDRVPEELPLFSSEEHGRGHERSSEAQIRRWMEDAGFQEALNFTLVARAEDARFSRWPDDVVSLSNPMSERGDVLRSSLLSPLLRNLSHNLSHGATRVRLYELGRIFRNRADAELPEERLHLGFVATGSAATAHWSQDEIPVDPFDLTGVLEMLIDRLRAPRPGSREGGPAYLDPRASACRVLEGREMAWTGRLETSTARNLGIEADVMVAEMDLTALLERVPGPVRYRPIPRYPSVVRDLSLVLPQQHGYAAVEEIVRQEGGNLVVGVRPFDRYSGPGLPENAVGLSVSIAFQHGSRTLRSDEVDDAQGKIVAGLERELGARLRE